MRRPLSFRLQRLLLPLSVMAFLILFSTNSFAQVSGTVFRDLPVNGATANTYGVKQANESGVGGVTVTVFGTGGGTTITAANGTWSIPAATGEVRVEYSGWPVYLKESFDGGGVNSSVQFATAPASNVNFGLHNPADFSQSSPPVATVHFINGASSAGGLNNTIVSFGYTATGSSGQSLEANKSQVGAVWGLAYSKTRGVLYSSAFLKRHVGLGTNGLGAIYSTNIAAGANGSFFIGIPNVGSINEGARGLASVNGLSGDVEAFSKIGKVGLGDIDISDDEKYLYVTNLNDKKLYVIDIDGSTISGSYNIPDPGCISGVFRPFAVKYKDGLVYVGGVCDASSGSASNLRAYVYVFDPVTLTFNSTPELDFSMNYIRGGSVWGNGATGAAGETANQHTDNWYPWVDVYTKPNFNTVNFGGDPRDLPSHPQPIFSDIEFVSNGNMILNFMDRTGHQFGESNRLPTSGTLAAAIAGGDILLATKSGSTWTIEPHVTASGNEFFSGEYFLAHKETSSGGGAILPGSTQLFSSAMDPIAYTSGGVIKLSTNTGTQPSQGVQVYQGTNSSGNFGKATGMGDVELMTNPSPIEIGNLVWQDDDADGVQDAGEMGIMGVEVKLYKADGTTLIGTATTDANGNYIFSSATGQSSTSSHIYGISMLMPDQVYKVRIEDAIGLNAQSAIVGPPTVANTGEGTNTDLNDSDGVLNGTATEAMVMAADVPSLGANNHSFDFGFKSCPPTRCSTVNVTEN